MFSFEISDQKHSTAIARTKFQVKTLSAYLRGPITLLGMGGTAELRRMLLTVVPPWPHYLL